MVELRQYQQQSVDALLEYWLGGGGNGLIVLPTGAGKSLVAAALARSLYEEYDARLLIATHVGALITQNARKLQEHWPVAPVGIYSAGLRKRDGGSPIVIGGIQSIYKSPEVIGPRDVLLIDEAHLISHRDSGMYRELIRWLEDRTPGMRIGGLTATPWRLSSGRLDEDYGEHKALFEDVVFESFITDLIAQGYLSPITPYVSPDKIDLSGVKLSAGEYNLKQLAEAVDRDDINARVVAETIRAGENRRMWLVFASSVEHAQHLCALLRSAGVDTEIVTGDTPEQERETYFDRARAGRLRCLVGMNVMTTGLDIPNIDLIANVRPTKSQGLWVQMLGRGTRCADGKSDCLLLDFSRNSLDLGCIDQIDGKKVPGEKGKAPSKECPECHAVAHASAEVCKICGYNFPLNTLPNYRPVSNAGPVFSNQSEPKWWMVEGIVARRHTKPSAPDSLRIEYECGVLSVSHWIALESEKAGGMAKGWWKRHSATGDDPPETVTQALDRLSELRIPGRIQVMREGKWDRIIDWDYSIPAGKVIPVRTEVCRTKFDLW